MPLDALPALDRTSATFKTDLDAYFLTELPAFSTQAEALRLEVVAKQAAADLNQTAAETAAALATTNGATQVGLAAEQVTLAADQVALATSAKTAAESAATNSAASANYKGTWASLAGALAMPASVSHNGSFWLLNSGLANVTTATPGVSASWTLVGNTDGGATETSSAEDITLTALSTRVQAVAMTATDKAVILPDATTLNLGGALFVVKNTGTIAIAIRNTAGALITMATAGQTVLLYLTNKATAAGAWAFGAASAQQSGTLFNGTVVSVNSVVSTKTRVTPLSATQALVIFRNATSQAQACTLNISNGTITPGATITLNATVYGSEAISLTMLSATQALAIYAVSVTTINARVLSVSGTVVTAGAELAIGPLAGAEKISISALSATQVIMVYGSATDGYLATRTLNVSGTTVTAGAELITNAVYSPNKSVVALSATQAVVAYSGTTSYLSAITLNISGTTVTAGALLTANAAAIGMVMAVKLSATQAVAVYTRSGNINACTLDVSGTGLTNGAIFTVATVSAPANMGVAVISGSHVLVTYPNNSTYLQASLIGISGTTVSSVVSPLVVNAVATLWADAAVLSNNRAIVTYQGASSYLQAAIIESAL